MPSYLSDPEVDLARLDDALGAPPSKGFAFDAMIGEAGLTHRLYDAVGKRFDGVGPALDPNAANETYGVPGYLTFEKPVGELEASRQSAAAHRRAFHDYVSDRSTLNPLEKIGSGLAGALFDPVAMPLFMAPEVLGLRGALEGAAGARTVGALAKSGRLANVGRGAFVGTGEGFVNSALYEGANYGLARYNGDPDATLGESLQNVVWGTVFGAGLGGLGGALHGKPPGARPAAEHAPSPIAEMPEDSRLGAAAMAVDRAAADLPVEVAPLADRELAARRPTAQSLGTLDEGVEGARIPGKLLEEDVAVTTRGTEIPVRYALVELSDLTTSHTDDLQANPDFPAALQPRDRTRAGSQAGNHRLEAELNPKRLMRDRGAETGAPLIAPDGTVESGNGRAIALRRSATRGSEAYDRYTAELKAQGFDTEGMSQPVLVRMRTQAMSGDARAALTREMNAAPTETMGPAEQALSDAHSLDDAVLARLDGTAQGDRAFARAFIAKVAPDQQNALADASGHLSAVGQARMKAALVARAYGDPGLVEAVFEAADPNIKALGAALSEAAPAWAKMRSLAQRGEIPPELDLTPQLQAAVALIRHARDHKIPVHEFLADRLSQVELFGGNSVDAETEAFLRLMFRDPEFRRARGADNVAWALKDYARQASEVTPGPNLFGETPDGDAKLILDGLAAKFAKSEPFPQAGDLLSHAPERPAEAPVVDLRPDAGERPGGGGLQQGGVQDPAGHGARPAEGAGPVRPDPESLIDPELKQLADLDLADTPPAAPKDDPKTIAEAIRAAAFCLKEG